METWGRVLSNDEGKEVWSARYLQLVESSSSTDDAPSSTTLYASDLAPDGTVRSHCAYCLHRTTHVADFDGNGVDPWWQRHALALSGVVKGARSGAAARVVAALHSPSDKARWVSALRAAVVGLQWEEIASPGGEPSYFFNRDTQAVQWYRPGDELAPAAAAAAVETKESGESPIAAASVSVKPISIPTPKSMPMGPPPGAAMPPPTEDHHAHHHHTHHHADGEETPKKKKKKKTTTTTKKSTASPPPMPSASPLQAVLAPPDSPPPTPASTGLGAAPSVGLSPFGKLAEPLIPIPPTLAAATKGLGAAPGVGFSPFGPSSGLPPGVIASVAAPVPVTTKKKKKKMALLEMPAPPAAAVASSATIAPPMVAAADEMLPPPPVHQKKKKKKKKKKMKKKEEEAEPPSLEAPAAPLPSTLPTPFSAPPPPVGTPPPPSPSAASIGEEDDGVPPPPPPPPPQRTTTKSNAMTGNKQKQKQKKKKKQEYSGWSDTDDDSGYGSDGSSSLGPMPPAAPTPQVKMPTKKMSRRMSCFLISSSDGLHKEIDMNKDASRLEVVQVILENFESIDEDGSGSISPEELTAGMALANVDRTIVKAIIKALDADGNGEIEKIELIDEERRLQNILDANDPMRKKMSVSALKKKKTGARRTRRGSVVGHSGGGRASSRSMSPPPIDPRKVGAPLPPGSATADKRTNPAGSPNAVKARKRRVRRLSILAGIDSSGDRYSMIRAIMDNFGSVSGESGGGLSKDQLRLCLPPETSADEADKLFREIDKDGSGSIEFFELQAELARLKGTGDTTGASTKKLSTFQKMQLAAQKKADSTSGGGGGGGDEEWDEETEKKAAAKRNAQVKDTMLKMRQNLGWDEHSQSDEDDDWMD